MLKLVSCYLLLTISKKITHITDCYCSNKTDLLQFHCRYYCSLMHSPKNCTFFFLSEVFFDADHESEVLGGRTYKWGFLTFLGVENTGL